MACRKIGVMKGNSPGHQPGIYIRGEHLNKEFLLKIERQLSVHPNECVGPALGMHKSQHATVLVARNLDCKVLTLGIRLSPLYYAHTFRVSIPLAVCA